MDLGGLPNIEYCRKACGGQPRAWNSIFIWKKLGFILIRSSVQLLNAIKWPLNIWRRNSTSCPWSNKILSSKHPSESNAKFRTISSESSIQKFLSSQRINQTNNKESLRLLPTYSNVSRNPGPRSRTPRFKKYHQYHHWTAPYPFPEILALFGMNHFGWLLGFCSSLF